MLRHQNIVALYGEFCDEENVYIITEYCTNGNLYTYIKEKRRNEQPVDYHEASEILKQISGAVALMHEKSLMHRDIKP
jgi:serine/threonine protein kinase